MGQVLCIKRWGFTMKIFMNVTCFSSLISRCLLIILLALTLTSVVTAQESGTAQLTIEGNSQSSSVGSRSYTVTKYADEACSKLGKTDKVFRKKYAKSVHTFKALAVDSSQPFIFQVSYLEERRSEIKRCAAIASVDLKENGNYKAVFSIVDEVLGCNIKIYDMDPDAVAVSNEPISPSLERDEIAAGGEVGTKVANTDEAQQGAETLSSAAGSPIEVEYTKPAETCSKVGKMGYKNGTPVYTYKDRFG
jgi:hypothetical protein